MMVQNRVVSASAAMSIRINYIVATLCGPSLYLETGKLNLSYLEVTRRLKVNKWSAPRSILGVRRV